MVNGVHFHGDYKIETETGNGGSLFRVSIYYGKLIAAIIDVHLDPHHVDATVYTEMIHQQLELVDVDELLGWPDQTSHCEDVAEPDGHATQHQPRLV